MFKKLGTYAPGTSTSIIIFRVGCAAAAAADAADACAAYISTEAERGTGYVRYSLSQRTKWEQRWSRRIVRRGIVGLPDGVLRNIIAWEGHVG